MVASMGGYLGVEALMSLGNQSTFTYPVLGFIWGLFESIPKSRGEDAVQV